MESQNDGVNVSIHMENENCSETELRQLQEKTESSKNTVLDYSSPDTSLNYDEFIHNVRLDTTVLDGLISKCYLTIEDREEIMSQPRLSERNIMIINILMARPYNTFQTLTTELIEFDRSKMTLVSKLKNYDTDGGKIPPFLKTMDISNHTIILQKNFKILVNELANQNTIVDHLISNEVLCLEDRAEIYALNNSTEQSNRLLLTKLMYKNADAFTVFLTALKEDTCYEDLARRIERTEVTDDDKIMIHIGRNIAKEKREKDIRGLHKCEPTENIIPTHIQEHHSALIEQWRTEDETFVCTKAADEVLKRIKNSTSVIVSGNSGVGKTATMRHVALLLKNEGYRIIPTCIPEDLRDFSVKGIKTLFVIDDICGHFTLKEQQVDKWEEILAHLQPFLDLNPCKIIATCRLQVIRDAKFKALALFNSSECNLNSDTIKLTIEEKSRLAKIYFKEHADEVKGLSDQFDFFPLLCKLYQKSSCDDINIFLHSPFEFYRKEIERLLIEGDGGKLKYCCLVLCVIFNNRIDENLLKSTRRNIHIQSLIEDAFNECKLNKGTSVECLKESFKTLENTYLTKENGTYKTIHDKLFDFLAQIIGQNNMDYCIKYCSSEFIRERFLWKLSFASGNDSGLLITLCDEQVDIYINRIIQDWSKGLVANVFSNINIKKPEFVDTLLKCLKSLDPSDNKTLAQKADNESNDSPLLLSSSIGNILLTEWVLENTRISTKNKNLREVVLRLNTKLYFHPDINMQKQNGATSLYVACENGHLKILKTLLQYGADVTLEKNTGDSSLSVACENGHTNIVHELLENTNINKDGQNRDGYSPLYLACQNGHEEAVHILLKCKANMNLCSNLGFSPLFIACKNGHLSVVKQMLRYGADINCQNNAQQIPLHAACYTNRLEVVRLLLKTDSTSVNHLDKNNISPLYASCQCSKGHFEVMEELLNQNADVSNGRSPLIMTCENGNTKMCQTLIERNANVDLCVDDRVSPLFMACQNCHYDTVCFLLKSGADPNVCRENGASPLVISSQNGNVRIVKELLKQGSNINQITTSGVSSLYIAAQNGHVEVLCLLIYAKADLDMADTDNKTALFQASKNGHLDIVLMLLKSEADMNVCMKNNITPMKIAEKNNHLDVVRALKDHARKEQKKLILQNMDAIIKKPHVK